MNKTVHKETQIGNIPIDWNIKNIGEISIFVGSGVTPRGGQKVYKNQGIPFIRSQNVYPSGLRMEDLVYVDEKQNEKMRRTELKSNDVLLNITGASIGRSTYIPIGFGKANVNQHVCIIRPISEIVSARFISSYLNSSLGKRQIDKFNSGSSREGLNFQQVKSIQIPIPSKKEQEKIADILYTVDEQINQIDQLINYTVELKRGLIEDIISNGLGKDNFRKTEIGDLPIDWKVEKISDLSEVITKGTTPTTEGYDFVDIGINYIKGENISDMGYLIGGFLKISEECHNALRRSQIQEDDILVSIVGSIGKSVVVSKEYLPANTNQNVAIIKVRKEKVNPKYINIIFQSRLYKEYVKIETTTGVQPSMSLKQVGNFKVPVPSIKEQNYIVEIISNVIKLYGEYREKKEKLTYIKKGLMQKLLTGQIRVKL